MEELKTVVLDYLRESLIKDSRISENIIYVGSKSYTIEDIIFEIENDTKFGILYVQDILKLSIDLVLRGKEKINER